MTPILISKILALTYISAGIGALTGRITYSKLVEDFERSPGLTYLGGFMALVFGVIILHYHNIWVPKWTVLITLVGWLSLIKGIMLIAFPQYILKVKGWYKDTSAWGVCMIVLGLVFAYFGFMI